MTTTHATSRWVGRAVWVEQRLFEVVGGWVATTTDDEATAAIASLSRHHAWRADVLAELLSTYGGTAPDDHGAGPEAAVEAGLVLLADLPSDVDRLAGLARSVLPRLVVAHDGFLADASPVSGRPAVRLVTVARDDLVADWRRVEALLQRRAAPADVGAMLAAVERLEGRLADAGGILGRP